MPKTKSLCKLCFFVVGLASLIAAIGCGGSALNTGNTSGSYSNASLKGSYVFQIRGFLSTGAPYRQVGIVTADGNGNITAGTDITAVSGAGGVPSESTSVTGTYSIANDGTGDLLLNSTALGSLLGVSGGQITFAVTLASSSTAELMEADSFAVGSGVANLQSSTAMPSGAFIFRLHDETNGQSSASEVGIFNFSGSTLTGSFDQGLISSGSQLTISSGSITAPSVGGIGTISFTDSSSATTNLTYCVVSSSQFVFIVSTSGSVGSGSAEAQSGAVSAGLSGTYVFGSRGDDLTSVGAVAKVGEFAASGGTISTGALDAMQDGNYTGPVNFTGSTAGTPSAQGRVAVSLSTAQTLVLWLVNPSRAFLLFGNESATEDGTADLQTGSSFSAGTLKGQYALVMGGLDFVNSQALARIGTMQFDGSSKITLVELANASGTGTGAASPGTLSGNYQVGGSGRITSQITNNNGGGPDLVMYAISGTQAYVLQSDSGEDTSGTLQLQQ